jgi:hypothetical protein
MKSFFASAAFLLATNAFAHSGQTVSPKWSAFTSNNVLFVTVIGDGCNGIHGSLRVPDRCNKNRLSKNGVVSCTVDLVLVSTAKACEENLAFPQVVAIPLDSTEYATEARGLTLRMGPDRVHVGINK